jgi:hypothetical protein
MPGPTPAASGNAQQPGLGDLAVITCHFNWGGFSRPSQNLHRFIRYMKSLGVPVFGVEAILPGQTAHTSNMSGWKQITADPDTQIMFQKERLLNLAEKMVPARFVKIAWLDADVMFSNIRWADETSALLDHMPFVQPFELAVWTEFDGREIMRKPSTLRMKGGMPLHSHPGFAMAARRSLWTECGGLFDKLIVGNGDTGIATAILNTDLPATQTYSPELMAEYMRWRSLVSMKAGGNYGWTRGNIYHEWHGTLANRKYAERNTVLQKVVPLHHLWTAANGLLTWKENAPKEVVEYVRGYFMDRQEDGAPHHHPHPTCPVETT